MYLRFIIVGVILLSIYLGYRYVNNLNEQIKTLTTENTKLTISNRRYEIERKQLLQNIKENKQSYQVLLNKLDESERKRDYLIRIFADHDFNKLVKRKPKTITKLMRKATKKVFKEIEDETK